MCASVCVVKGREERRSKRMSRRTFPVGTGPGPGTQHPLTPPRSTVSLPHLLSILQKVQNGETATPPFVSGVFDVLFPLLTFHFPHLRVEAAAAAVGGAVSRPGHLYNRSYYNSASLKRSTGSLPGVDFWDIMCF